MSSGFNSSRKPVDRQLVRFTLDYVSHDVEHYFLALMELEQARAKAQYAFEDAAEDVEEQYEKVNGCYGKFLHVSLRPISKNLLQRVSQRLSLLLPPRSKPNDSVNKASRPLPARQSSPAESSGKSRRLLSFASRMLGILTRKSNRLRSFVPRMSRILSLHLSSLPSSQVDVLIFRDSGLLSHFQPHTISSIMVGEACKVSSTAGKVLTMTTDPILSVTGTNTVSRRGSTTSNGLRCFMTNVRNLECWMFYKRPRSPTKFFLCSKVRNQVFIPRGEPLCTQAF